MEIFATIGLVVVVGAGLAVISFAMAAVALIALRLVQIVFSIAW